MTLTKMVQASCLAAAVLMLPASGLAAHRGCQLTQTDTASGPCPCATASMSPKKAMKTQHEADRLLATISRDAYRIRTQADAAESEYPFVSTGWEIQADELTMIRDNVNDMGQRLCRLEKMHDQLTPNQQKAVEQTAPLIKELSIFTADAIHYVNDHKDDLWNPVYRTYIHDIHLDANHVSPAVHNEG